MSKKDEIKDVKITLDIKCSSVYNGLSNDKIKEFKEKFNNKDFLNEISEDIKEMLGVDIVDKVKFNIKTSKSEIKDVTDYISNEI